MGGRGRVDFQLAVRFTQGATVGKTPVYCMKMAKCAQYSTVQEESKLRRMPMGGIGGIFKTYTLFSNS